MMQHLITLEIIITRNSLSNYWGPEGARVKVSSLFFSYYLSCSEFPERLQSLNSDIEPGY